MVRIGFIVEGFTEKILIESARFKQWANNHDIDICPSVINAEGGDNLLPHHIKPMVELLQLESPDYIVILTDLERDSHPQIVKDRIANAHTKLIFVAVKAIEAWFLADSEALSFWLKTQVYEEYPEETTGMPWDRLGELAKELGQKGTGARKQKFAERMTQYYGFDLTRAANHPNCPSAKEFHDGLINLAK